jgi:hypothetical protein
MPQAAAKINLMRFDDEAIAPQALVRPDRRRARVSWSITPQPQ